MPGGFLGVDPGAKGALALVTFEGAPLWVEDMPSLTGAALGAALRDLLEGEAIQVACVEQVASRPGQGVRSMFTFGANWGAILGALGALNIPTELVTPSKWKPAMQTSGDKDLSRQRAIERWPSEAARFARKKDDGRAEACLIAEWRRTRVAR